MWNWIRQLLLVEGEALAHYCSDTWEKVQPEISSRHTTHTRAQSEGPRKGERTFREVTITVASWLPVGLDADIVYEHIWKHCYIIILILLLWWAKTTKGGRSLTYCSLTSGCTHSLLLRSSAEMSMNYHLLFCRVRCSDPGRSCWAPEPCRGEHCSALL